ncbi:hypothetical protein LZ30DRAFT_229931 [Colletotrichum cereale]|nr:hypothetical protein LZ30DRAFT_229931 [Colletotrichum cereale]
MHSLYPEAERFLEPVVERFLEPVVDAQYSSKSSGRMETDSWQWATADYRKVPRGTHTHTCRKSDENGTWRPNHPVIRTRYSTRGVIGLVVCPRGRFQRFFSFISEYQFYGPRSRKGERRQGRGTIRLSHCPHLSRNWTRRMNLSGTCTPAARLQTHSGGLVLPLPKTTGDRFANFCSQRRMNRRQKKRWTRRLGSAVGRTDA